MQTFCLFMLGLFAFEILNIMLCLRKVYTAIGMLVFGNIFFSITSTALLLALKQFSMKIRDVLHTIESISERDTVSQSNRIYAITIVAYVFFVLRIIVELTSLIGIMHCIINKIDINKYTPPLFYKDLYICLFYWPEVCVLLLELIIASSMSQSNQSNQSNGDNAEQQPQQQQQVIRVHGGTTYSNSMRSTNTGSEMKPMHIKSHSANRNHPNSARRSVQTIISCL